jgi:hypothetical protein
MSSFCWHNFRKNDRVNHKFVTKQNKTKQHGNTKQATQNNAIVLSREKLILPTLNFLKMMAVIWGGMQKSEGLPVTRPNFSMTMKKLARGYRQSRLTSGNPDFCIHPLTILREPPAGKTTVCDLSAHVRTCKAKKGGQGGLEALVGGKRRRICWHSVAGRD